MTYEPQKRHFIINVFGVHIMTDNVSHFSTTRKCPYIRWAMHFDATVVQYRKIVVQYRKMIRYCDRIYSLLSLFSLEDGSHSNQPTHSLSRSTCLPLALAPPPITFTIKTFASSRQSLARSSFVRSAGRQAGRVKNDGLCFGRGRSCVGLGSWGSQVTEMYWRSRKNNVPGWLSRGNGARSLSFSNSERCEVGST